MSLKTLAAKLKEYQPQELNYGLIQQVKEARLNGLEDLSIPFDSQPTSDRPLAKLAFELKKQANTEQNNLIKEANYFLDVAKMFKLLKDRNDE